MNLFEETFEVMGVEVDKNQLYERLFNHTQHADEQNGNLLSYGYISGENIYKNKQRHTYFLETNR